MNIKILILVCFLLFIAPVSGTPTITNSSPGQFSNIDVGDTVNFSISTDEEITTYVWVLDGVTIDSDYNYSLQSWTTPGSKSISVNASNANGSAGYTWHAVVFREKSDANGTISGLNVTWFDILTDTMGGYSPDFTQFFAALMLPFTDNLGNMFYLFVYLLPVAVIWIRQEKAILPVVLGVIFGGLLIGILPEAWQGPAILFIVLTTLGIIYSLFKERG